MMNPGSSEVHPAITRAGAAILLAIAMAITGSMALGGAEAGAATAKVKIKQPKCGKLKKKSKVEQCKDDRKVRKAIGNARFFGTRADGESIDTLYCENGIHQNDVRLDRYNENVRTVGWRVESSNYKSETNFTAILYSKEGKADFIQSVSLKGEVWKLGTVKKKTKLKLLGVAEKQDGRPACSRFGQDLLDLDPIPAPDDEE